MNEIRELCLVLDTKGYYRLILKSGTSKEIDKFTSRKFCDSSAVRRLFKDEIDAYLNKYKDELEKSNNPNYKGRIVVVDPKEVGKDIVNYQKKVLYKKHAYAFLKFIKDKTLATEFTKYEMKKKDNCLITKQFFVVINSNWNMNNTKTYINEWLKDIKNKDYYYDIIRDMMAVYEIESKYRTLPKIDDIYDKHKKSLALRLERKNNLKLSRENNTLVYPVEFDDKKYNVNGFLYSVDELHLFDLDEIEDYSDYIPDGKRK